MQTKSKGIDKEERKDRQTCWKKKEKKDGRNGEEA